MATGTATQSDAYWLSQSTVFKNRVQSALVTYCNTINSETPTGVTGSMPNVVHQARKSMVSTILNPSNFSNWLTQFVMIAADDGNVLAAATQASSNYTPITVGTGTASTGQSGDTAAADGQSPNVTSTLISNAIAAAFNSVVSGI